MEESLIVVSISRVKTLAFISFQCFDEVLFGFISLDLILSLGKTVFLVLNEREKIPFFCFYLDSTSHIWVIAIVMAVK